MTHSDERSDALPEERLDALREEAVRTGSVTGAGTRAAGGPMPALAADSGAPGYYGRPIVKPPVWTWEIPLYFFFGGLAGMAAAIALAAHVVGPGVEGGNGSGT